jgi:hypothetical protein
MKPAAVKPKSAPRKVDLPIEPYQLPLKQFFKFVGVGPTKGHALIKSGALKTRKIGKKRIGLISEGREFLKSLPTK